MAWRIYKEGQGKWLRGCMAGLIFIGGIAAVRSLHILLHGIFPNSTVTIPGIHWQTDLRYLVDAPALVGILAWGIFLYNKPKVVDFLIETESELKNKVTWPTKKEELNASVVVVITVVIMMFFIFGIDTVFTVIKNYVYK